MLSIFKKKDNYQPTSADNYNIEDQIYGNYIRVRINGSLIKFSIKITPYACGILQLGELDFEIRANEPDKHKLYTAIIKLMDLLTRDYHCVMITTNGNGSSMIMDEILEFSKKYNMVKEFQSNQTDANIKVWINK